MLTGFYQNNNNSLDRCVWVNDVRAVVISSNKFDILFIRLNYCMNERTNNDDDDGGGGGGSLFVCETTLYRGGNNNNN